MEKEQELQETEATEETVETVASEIETEEIVDETVESQENEKEEEKLVKESKPEKPKKEREGRSIVSRILNVVLWIVLLAWMALVVTDYIHVHNEEKPQFCWFNEKTTSYDDGSVTECTGLGYKVINYNRNSFKAIEFGPFWITDRTAEENK